MFQLMLAHESGEWEAAELSKSMRLDSEEVAGSIGRRSVGAAGFDGGVKTAELGPRTLDFRLWGWIESGMSCPPVQKTGGMGLARLGEDEYDKGVLI